MIGCSWDSQKCKWSLCSWILRVRIHIVQTQIMLGCVVCFANDAEGGTAVPRFLPCNEQG